MSAQGMQGPDGQDGLTQAEVDARIEAMTADLRGQVEKLQAWKEGVQTAAAKLLVQTDASQAKLQEELERKVDEAERTVVRKPKRFWNIIRRGY